MAVTATGTPLGIMGVIEGATTATSTRPTDTITGTHTVTNSTIDPTTAAIVTGDDTTAAVTVISKAGLRHCSLEQREIFGSASMAANPRLLQELFAHNSQEPGTLASILIVCQAHFILPPAMRLHLRSPPALNSLIPSHQFRLSDDMPLHGPLNLRLCRFFWKV